MSDNDGNGGIGCIGAVIIVIIILLIFGLISLSDIWNVIITVWDFCGVLICSLCGIVLLISSLSIIVGCLYFVNK
jgi:hypothetical protein